jgi:hypothetical protein
VVACPLPSHSAPPRFVALAALALAACGARAPAQTATGNASPCVAPAAPVVSVATDAAQASASAASSSSLGPLAWLAGSWIENRGLGVIEEQWMAPAAGTMFGVGRTIESNRVTSFEFLRIEDSPKGPIYWALPRGERLTPFPLLSMEKERVVFENPEHDYPHRISYWRQGDKLRARIEGTVRGTPQSEEWEWRRAPPP